MNIRNKVAIIGAGCSQFGERYDARRGVGKTAAPAP